MLWSCLLSKEIIIIIKCAFIYLKVIIIVFIPCTLNRWLWRGFFYIHDLTICVHLWVECNIWLLLLWCLFKHVIDTLSFLLPVKLTSGTIEKLIPVRQCFSAGNRIPYFSGISGRGALFFSWASSSKNSLGGGVVNEWLTRPCIASWISSSSISILLACSAYTKASCNMSVVYPLRKSN